MAKFIIIITVIVSFFSCSSPVKKDLENYSKMLSDLSLDEYNNRLSTLDSRIHTSTYAAELRTLFLVAIKDIDSMKNTAFRIRDEIRTDEIRRIHNILIEYFYYEKLALEYKVTLIDLWSDSKTNNSPLADATLKKWADAGRQSSFYANKWMEEYIGLFDKYKK